MLELAKDFIEKDSWVVFAELESKVVANRWDVKFDPGYDNRKIIVMNLKLIVDEDHRKEVWDALISGENRFQEIKDTLNDEQCYPLPDLIMIYYILYQKNIREWKAKTISLDDMKDSKGQWISQLLFQELMRISQKEAKLNAQG